jgi:hypothetical protein
VNWEATGYKLDVNWDPAGAIPGYVGMSGLDAAYKWDAAHKVDAGWSPAGFTVGFGDLAVKMDVEWEAAGTSEGGFLGWESLGTLTRPGGE